jgi:hypothetical protein
MAPTSIIGGTILRKLRDYPVISSRRLKLVIDPD